MSLEARPIEGDSQTIGKLAGRALSCCLPDNWTEQPLSGDTDFGIDYLVQVKNQSGAMQFNFYLQLKGTKSPTKLSDGSAISFQFDVATLNYYRNLEPALMVALVDLSVADRPKDCPVYYLWMDELFLDSIKDRREKNDKISIRIPTSQIIDHDLDISDYYNNRLEKRNELHEFSQTIAKYSSDPLSDIAAFTKAIKDKPVIISSIKDDSGTPWIINPEGHNSTILKTINDYISNNRIIIAQEEINKILENTQLTDHEKAEAYSLQSTIEILNNNKEMACLLARQANETFHNSRYLVNWINAELMVKDLEKCHLEDFINILDPKDFRQCFTSAKCLCLLNNGHEAIDLISRSHPDNAIGIWLIALFAGDENAVSNMEKNIDATTLPQRSRYIYFVFLSRRLFEKGTNEKFAENKIIPFSGKVDFEFNTLREALKYSELAWSEAEYLGFPQDIELLLDISVLLYSMFGLTNKLIILYEKILEERPKNLHIRKSLAHMYFNNGDYNNAVKLLSSTNEHQDYDALALLISSKLAAKEKNNALEMLKANKEQILLNKPQNYKQLFLTAAQAAYELLDNSTEKELLEVVHSFDDSNILLALYDYFKKARKNPNKIKEYNSEIINIYQSNNYPHIIANQIFHNLDAHDETEALWAVEIGNNILCKRELFETEMIHLSQALSTLNKWNELEQLADKAIQRWGASHTWILIKVIGIHEQGKIAEALDLLDSSVDNEKKSIERAERFVGLCMSLNLYEKAEAKLNVLLEKSIDHHKKRIKILGSLIHIYSSWGKNEKLIYAIKRFGEYVDQNNEEEEGQYLKYILLLTNKETIETPELIEDFQARYEVFIKNFPNSKMLRSGTFPENLSHNEILNTLHQLTGITEEKINEWKKNKNLLRQKRLAISYSLIHKFLNDTQDVFGTWLMGICYPSDHKEYHLYHSDRSHIDKISSSCFIEETSLLLLSELGILDKVLDFFDVIYITRYTHELVVKKSHPIYGSIYSKAPTNITQSLNNNLRKITQIGDFENNLYIEYNKNILNKINDSIILSDDGVYQAMFTKFIGNNRFANSLDIIDFMFKNNALAEREKIELIEKMCNYPIYDPSITIDEIAQSAIVNLHNGDIFNTGFKYIFNKVFYLERESLTAHELFSELLSILILNCDAQIYKSPIQFLIKKFLIRYATTIKTIALSRIFVYTCIFLPKEPIHQFIPKSKYHSIFFL